MGTSYGNPINKTLTNMQPLFYGGEYDEYNLVNIKKSYEDVLKDNSESSSLKYLLIITGGEWCMPCYNQSPYIKAALAKYKEVGLLYFNRSFFVAQDANPNQFL